LLLWSEKLNETQNENQELQEMVLDLQQKNKLMNDDISHILMKSIYTLNEKVLLLNNLQTPSSLPRSVDSLHHGTFVSQTPAMPQSIIHANAVHANATAHANAIHANTIHVNTANQHTQSDDPPNTNELKYNKGIKIIGNTPIHSKEKKRVFIK
jgi:hypothetical protein